MNVFFVYPQKPFDIGVVSLELKGKLINQRNIIFNSWEELDIAGNCISHQVLQQIDDSDLLLADITSLNFNVFYEIGYAIGKNKKVVNIINSSKLSENRELTQLGLFDTIGYKNYSNSNELLQIIEETDLTKPIHIPNLDINRSAPIYLLEPLHKTDATIRITSKLNKAKIKYRVYDPKETPRCSLVDFYKNVKQSIAVIVNLVSKDNVDEKFNNLRGAFIAGLSVGFKKDLLLFQEGYFPVPIDYREMVKTYQAPADNDKHINDLAPRVIEFLQKSSDFEEEPVRNRLTQIDLGQPSAENEYSNLNSYYIHTDQYKQVLSGNAKIVVGRKGSGKTALFYQVRDKQKNFNKNLIIDLKPEGHQLKRLKDIVLVNTTQTSQEHLMVAFWEYILLLEICRKVIDNYKLTPARDSQQFSSLERLEELYLKHVTIDDIDFSERILDLVNRIVDKFVQDVGMDSGKELHGSEIISLVYKSDIPELRDGLSEYLRIYEKIILLFDNIDKSWPTRGVEPIDILVLRSLIDAGNKIQKLFRSKSIEMYPTVFIRNDVFENLVDGTPDRGKDSKVMLDWTERPLLREFIKRRLVFNEIINEGAFEEIWRSICVSHVNGEDSFDYILDRSLMRPRNLLTLINHCKSIAINNGHEKIQEVDIAFAVKVYSSDLSNEIGLEIRDVFPKYEDIAYIFIGEQARMSQQELMKILLRHEYSEEDAKKLIEILLWFSFLGVFHKGNEIFIYELFYDMKKLKRYANQLVDENTIYVIHRAFWPFLDINSPDSI